MKLKDLFGRKSDEKGVEHLATRETDSFANGVLFEIKAVVGSAIAQALQDKEGRYMKSILQESHFLLQGVSIKALDRETARLMEDFIATHESIEPDFRRNFFRQVLQSEYRSSGGARVRVSPDLVPVIELDRQTLEPQTEDESFILSLKGRRVRFEAQAVLEGPVRNAAAPAAQEAPRSTASSLGRAIAGTGHDPRTAPGRTSTQERGFHQAGHAAATEVRITVHDRVGRRTWQVPLPVILGRDVSHTRSQEGVHGVELDATYVSRRQLLVFELLGQVYCFVPRSASLTFSTHDQQVLRAECLQPLVPGAALRLTGGVPLDTLLPPVQRESAADYPVIELERVDAAAIGQDATPRPRAV